MNLEEKKQSLIDAGWNLESPLTEITPIFEGRFQRFQDFSIYENQHDNQAFEVHGAIYQKYLEFHETTGDLGFPASDEMDNPEMEGGKMSMFQYGIIYWTQYDGAYVQLYQHYEEADLLDWQKVLSDKSNYTSDDISVVINNIREKRDAVTTHVKSVPNGFAFFGKFNPKPTAIVAGSIEEWIWEEVSSEGSFDSINAYDNMIVTWGKGISKIHIPKILKSIFTQNPNLEEAFKSVGVAVDENKTLLVVDTTNSAILTNDDGFRQMKSDTKIIDFLADVVSNPDFQDVICNEQWKFVMNFAPGLTDHISANNWSKDAAQLMFHFSYWMPGSGWLANSSAYKATNGDPKQIILTFYKNQKVAKNDLVKKLKIFAGNSFKKYIALDEFLTELPEDQCAKFTDNSTTYYVPF